MSLYKRCSDWVHEHEYYYSDEYNPDVYNREIREAKESLVSLVKEEIRNHVLSDERITICSYERSLHIR